MARKPASSSSKTRKGTPLRNASRKHKPPHAQSLIKRTVAKHKARKAGRAWARFKPHINKLMAKTLRVPQLGLDLPVVGIMAFVGVLGFAAGAGYWGAQSMFGPTDAVVSASTTRVLIQQTQSPRGVILPEPNGTQPHGTLAYEEKALEEVYDPLHPQAVAPTSPPVEVASAPPPTADIPHDGDKPLWLRNALAFSAPQGAPMISIVIDDMGVDRKRSLHMWQDVPAPLTLSFMTYADDLPAQTQAARKNGHELMLHMSMEPSSATIDAGPNVLMTAMGSAEIRSLANWGMNRFEGFVGVNNHMGSRFTEDERAMRVVLEEIQKRGLMFLDSRTSSHTVGPKIARTLGMPALERNVFLDNDNVPEKVLKQLDEVERLARKYGHAIAIGHPRDATIEVLKTWIPKARERGLAIVPVSTLMKERLKRQTG
ncbi:divergent polysaccharide deacetylase family protein [Magnetovibrio sp.]|uniref:divergent polysaccharide deacetylase family protein n=1 Tax=Magnetovibrio sp. TaxID=2024836 RepID=UPI002F920A64